MREFEATTVIAAPPEAVWAVLVDIAAWPRWDSGIVKVSGMLAPGAKLEITGAGKVGRGYPMRVTAMDAPGRLVLTGSARLGLFTGERTYRLTPKSRGTRFHVREVYDGRLARVMLESMPDLTGPFQLFADGLKGRVEERRAEERRADGNRADGKRSDRKRADG